MSQIRVETIRFTSDGTPCAADIYYPEKSAAGKAPALVVCQGFSGVKEISVPVGTYFAQQGYFVLAIDYRTFGLSGGEPRGQLFPLWQVEDIRSAVSYLETRSEVDAKRIGLWGTSFAGGLVIYAAAVDRRVKAVSSQVPISNGKQWHQVMRTTVQWQELMDALDTDRRQRFRGEPSRRIPVSGLHDGKELVAMPADEQTVTLLELFEKNCPTYSPTITLQSLEKMLEYTPEDMIARISPRALLITAVSGRDICSPVEDVFRVFERAQHPKELVVLPYDRLDLYTDVGRWEALKRQLDFFRRQL